MIISIAQPCFLSWSGAYDRIAKSDMHIVLDHVPMSKDGGENRNKIRTKDGFQMLTVPVKNKGNSTPIKDIEIANDRHWKHKHIKAIHSNYARAPFYKKHISFFDHLYKQEWHSLCLLNLAIMGYMLDEFKINTPLVLSSNMEARGHKSDLNLNLCKEAGATVYLSGPFGRTYLNEKSFTDAGIEIQYHDYKTPEYKQVWDGFETNMSAIDALFCLGRLP